METILCRDPHKILIIKPSSLGDVVHSLPFLTTVRHCFPSAEIHWVIARGFEGLLEKHPMIDKLWIINKENWKDLRQSLSTFQELRALFHSLRSEAYDLVIDLQGLLRSGLIARAIRADVRIGFKEAREGSTLFYTHLVEGGKEIHAVDRYLKIAEALGCDIANPAFPMPEFEETDYVRGIKQAHNRYGVIIPGARKEANKWPAEKYAALAAKLKKNFLIVGSKADEELAVAIEQASEGFAKSVAGRTNLLELAEIIKGAEYVISNDTGPMHIAVAFGVPVVAVFGPANPVRTGPYGKENVVITSGLSCAPCYKRKCKDVKCMDAISVEKVYNAIKKRIKEER